jgi:hypothetical protein
MAFASPSKHLLRLAGKPAASLGIRQYAPPSTCSSASTTPASVATGFGLSEPPRSGFRPRGFAPPRRFAPHRSRRCIATCCRSWGSPCFSRIGRRNICGSRAVGPSRSSRRGSYPSKNPPRRQPHRITAAVAFLPFVACTRIAEAKRGHRRPEWAPIHRSGSPHIRPCTAEAMNKYVKRSRVLGHLSPDAWPRGASASRLSSTDESVTSCRRCQRNDVLSFHGLCSPSRYLRTRSTPVERMPSTIRGTSDASGRREAPVRPERRSELHHRTRNLGTWSPSRSPKRPFTGHRTQAHDAASTGRNRDCSRIGRATERWHDGYPIRSNPSESSSFSPSAKSHGDELHATERRTARPTLPKSVQS